MTELNVALEQAILAYKLKRAWQNAEKPELSEAQIKKIQNVATPEEARILNAPVSVVDIMSFMVHINFNPTVEQFVAMLADEAEEDWQAVTNECAKPMDLFARTTPEMFEAFKATISAEDRSKLHLLRDVAPNLIAVLEV